jgi:hypothetical protein
VEPVVQKSHILIFKFINGNGNMAHLRAANISEENIPAMRNVKAGTTKTGQQSLLELGSKRRVLHDIGNVVASTRAAADKENKGGKAGAKAKVDEKDAVVSHSAVGPAPTAATTLAPRAVRYQTRSVAALSMTELLATRSEAAVGPPTQAEPLPDIDHHDVLDPLEVTDYIGDIFSYYTRVEPKFRVPSDYMASQSDVNERMRAILVDWLVEVHLKFKLMQETLYLTVNLIDRFLAVAPVTRKNLQLVGVTAMLIASKYEEIWAPEVKDFVYISDKAYTKEQILIMEKEMLKALDWNLTLPTNFNFLGRFMKAGGVHSDKRAMMLANYTVELSLSDYSSLRFSYSELAAAAVHVTLVALKSADTFPQALQRHSSYTLQELEPCVRFLESMWEKSSTNTLTAVYKKYSQPKFLEVAHTPLPNFNRSA